MSPVFSLMALAPLKAPRLPRSFMVPPSSKKAWVRPARFSARPTICPRIVDVVGLTGGAAQCTQVDHLTIGPAERPEVTIGIGGLADDHLVVVDGDGHAVIAAQRAQAEQVRTRV
jgi:hypothetical protein